MARRTRNEGTIRKRADGRYEVRVTDPLTGKRRSIFAKDETAALDELKQAHRQIDSNRSLITGRLTVETYLARWLEGSRPRLRATTHQRYQQLITNQIVPRIGGLQLRALTPLHVRELYSHLLIEPRARSGNTPIAPRTVGHTHRVLRKALQDAMNDDLVSRNVAASVSPPSVPHQEMNTLTPVQVAALFDAADGSRFEAMVIVAATAGVRLGELLALQWSAVDLEAGTLRVRRSLAAVEGSLVFQDPKTPRSRRTVTLSRTAVRALKAHRARQNTERLAAIGWDEGDLVFPDPAGFPFHPATFSSVVWRPLRDEAQLPDGFRFHDLRHTAASLALSAGVPVTVVSEMLGHKTTAVTLTVYAHAVPGGQQQAADAMDAMLAAAGHR